MTDNRANNGNNLIRLYTYVDEDIIKWIKQEAASKRTSASALTRDCILQSKNQNTIKKEKVDQVDERMDKLLEKINLLSDNIKNAVHSLEARLIDMEKSISQLLAVNQALI